MSLQDIGQAAVSALALGSIYALVALGIAIVYNILDLINFAHGELLTVAGYGMSVFAAAGFAFGFTVVLGVACAVLAAVLLERVAFRPVRGAPPATLLLTSFAVALILQNVYLLIFGGPPRSIPYPGWLHEGFSIGGVRVEWIDVATFMTTVTVLVALNFALRRTVIGIALRAAADDFPAARLMGIRANRVVLSAFAVSGALAGLAAIFWLGNAGVVSPTSGTTPLLKGFIAAIIGGLGTLSGPVMGGFLLAATEALFQLVLPEAELAYVDAFVFAVVITVLFLRPQGLLRRRLAGAAET